MDEIDQDSNMLANISEQRFWNKDENWQNNDEEEWSIKFKNSQRLWYEFLFPRISQYITGDVLEIAPGHGRVTRYLIPLSKTLSLVDLNENCINACKSMFFEFNNIKYFVNDGCTLDCIEDDSIDFVLSWDSFVHMHAKVIENYIKEISKKLRVGRYGFIHHSNLWGGEELSFQNKAGRSNMEASIFAQYCQSNGLEVIHQEFYTDRAITDCITIFRKV
jgi:SAM-dependent methyltransferase